MPTRDTPWPAGTPCWADLAVPALRRLVAMEPGRRDAWARLLELHEAESRTTGDDRVAFSV